MILIGVNLLMFALVVWTQRMHVSEKRASAVLRVNLKSILAEAGRLRDELEAANRERGALRAGAQENESKVQRYFSAIDTACRQRDEWCQNYHDACSGFMRTQQALLAEVGRLSRIAKAPVRKVFEQMVQGYREEHAANVVRASEALKSSGSVAPALPEKVPSIPGRARSESIG